MTKNILGIGRLPGRVLTIGLLLSVGISSARGQTCVNWAQRSPAASPAARYGHALAYDSTRNVAVLFGGDSGGARFADTWEWNGTNWTQRSPMTSPPARASDAMAYDSTRGVTVLFGGFDSGQLGDTWEWNGTDWTQRSPMNSPAARNAHAMAYDSARGVTVLFGGSTPGYSGETWEWNGTDWTQRSPMNSPSARNGHAMCFDSTRNVTVLFGGQTGSRQSDTWEWNGTDWSQQSPMTIPSARERHALAYDGARGVSVLFGGYDGTNVRSDTLEWNGTNWTLASPPTSPTRWFGAMAYDSARAETVLFGGQDGSFNPVNDTWGFGAHAPTGASVDSPSYCSAASPATIMLTATGGSGTTLAWYSGSCGGTAVGTGSPLTITAPSSTTTYHARWETPGCGNSTCASVTVTVNPSPTGPSFAAVDSPSYCSSASPATIMLTATGGSGTTLAWYSGSCGGTSVGTGSPLTITAPAATTTYFARWETPSCGNSTCASVTVTVNPSPTSPTSATANSLSYCSAAKPSTIMLTATGGAGTTLAWYSDSCGGTSVGTGSPLTISAPSSTTTYFARWESSCGNSTCASVTVTVNNNPTPPTTATVDSPTYCSGAAPTNITLTASGGSGDSLHWYSGSCGGTSAGTGSPLTISAPTTTTTYFARWETSSCGNSTCASATVTVTAGPTAPIAAAVDSPNFCSAAAPSRITLIASGGSGGTLTWYGGSCGGTAVGTGSPLTIIAPTATTTYFARWETPSCGNSTCASVTVTVGASAACSITADGTVLPGTSGLTASAAAGASSYAWSLTDGTITAGQGTSRITYTAPSGVGSFTIRLTVTGAANCSDSCSAIVTLASTGNAPTACGTSVGTCGAGTGAAMLMVFPLLRRDRNRRRRQTARKS